MKKIDFSMITTRGGDDGKSTLVGGERRYKTDQIFNVLGDIDELNSNLGLVKFKMPNMNIKSDLSHIQKNLRYISSIIATPVNKLNKELENEHENYLDSCIKYIETVESDYIEYIKIDDFIDPGKTEISALLDICRTITRRAERSIVLYISGLPVKCYKLSQNYINRLSDLLFILARYMELN